MGLKNGAGLSRTSTFKILTKDISNCYFVKGTEIAAMGRVLEYQRKQQQQQRPRKVSKSGNKEKSRNYSGNVGLYKKSCSTGRADG
jgi:hypothetical protein